ncbi:hypothetical protein LIER_00775 [Lithospermum erythrorhizon]|uniref:MULE transposase domain-containing protein n=1 Tax=Lithospermum erythrorhizon TaxID=34254 RepID=A0AAV3NJS9_LITER
MVIGLDGCHTKGFYKQQILTAVGLDNNNGFYLLAWIVVENENYETWRWFIEGLIDDLKIRNQEKYIIISDKQKGLEQVVHDLFPGAARRNCVQDIYMNLKKTHGRGDYLRDEIWKIAKSTNKVDFKRAMKKLNDFNENAHSWMIDHAEARNMPLITMLELIRSKVMKIIKDRSVVISKKSEGAQQNNLDSKLKSLLNKKKERVKNLLSNPKEWPRLKGAPNVAVSEETEDPFVERRREMATRRGKGFVAMRGVMSKGFRVPRLAPIAWGHNEADDIVEILSLPEQPQNDYSDVEILKVVQDTTIDPSMSQREIRRVKRAILKHKSEQVKKKRRKN